MQLFQLGFYLRDENITSQKSHFLNVFSSVVHNNSKLKTNQKVQLVNEQTKCSKSTQWNTVH